MIVSITCVAALLRPWLGATCGLVILVLAMVVDGFLGFPLLGKFGRIWDGRVSLWFAAWFMFLQAPLCGHGPHTFVLFYRPYIDHLGLPSWLPVDPPTTRWPHNLYLEVLAEQGIVGLTALGFLLVSGIFLAWNSQRAASSDARIFGAAALAGLIGFCLAAVFELTFLRLWVVIVLFALLGVIAQMASAQT
jgi:O-antigen ligase